MASLATTIGFALAGAALGFVLPGVGAIAFGGAFGFAGSGVGAAIGFSLGAAIAEGGSNDARVVVGTKLRDLQVMGASFGDPIKVVRGTARVGGQVIWSSGLILDKDKKKEGGGTFSSGTEVTTIKYRVSAAVMICEGPITGIRKIWMDKQLVWNNGDDATAGDIELSKNLTKDGLTLYIGSATQDPDPVIEEWEGAGNVPAHRNKAYAVFNKLKVTKQFNNTFPNIEFEVVKDGTLLTPPRILNSLTTSSTDSAGKLDNGTVLLATVTNNASPIVYSLVRKDMYGETIQNQSFDIEASGSQRNERLCHNDPYFCSIAYAQGGTYLHVYYKGIQVIDYDVPSGTGPLGCEDYEAYGTWNDYNVMHVGKYWICAVGDNNTPNGLVRYIEGTGGRPTMLYDLAVLWTDIYPDSTVNSNYYIFPDVRSKDYFWVLRTTDPSPDSYRLVKMSIDFEIVNYWSSTTLPTIAYQSPGSPSRLYDGAAGNYMAKNSSGSYVVNLYSFDADTNDSTWTLVGQATMASTGGAAIVLGDNMLFVHDEVVTLDPLITNDTEDLADVVSDICLQANYTAGQIDVTDLAGTAVREYVYAGLTTARAAIEGLQRAFFFDAVEADDKIVFVKRGGSKVLTLTAEDLGAHLVETEAADPVASERTSELEMPRTLTVKYPNPTNNYEIGSQYARRLITEANKHVVIDLAVGLTDDEAAQVADVLLYNEYQSLETFRISVNESFLQLTATDLIEVPIDGNDVLCRILTENYSLDGLINYTLVPEHTPIYTQARSGAPSGATYRENIRQNGPAQLAFLDIPIINPGDDGLITYAGAAGFLTTWEAHNFYKFSDDSSAYNEIATFVKDSEATLGVSTDTLADHSANTIDRTSTVNIDLANSALTLSSSTEAAILQDDKLNLCLLGQQGNYELFQFITATLESDGTYTLSGLIRGRRGTGYATDEHADGDVFALIDPDTMITIPMPTGDIDAERLYKFAGYRQSLDEVYADPFTYTGRSKLPLYPAAVTAYLSGSDWVINWIHRTRLSADLMSNADIDDDSELAKYTVDFVDGSDVVQDSQTVAAGTETFTWTSAMQSASGFGAPQTDINVIVYQKGVTLDTEGHGLKWSTATETETIVDPKAA